MLSRATGYLALKFSNDSVKLQIGDIFIIMSHVAL